MRTDQLVSWEVAQASRETELKEQVKALALKLKQTGKEHHNLKSQIKQLADQLKRVSKGKIQEITAQLQESVARENKATVVVSTLTEKNTQLEATLVKTKKNLGLYSQRARQLDARVRALAEAEAAQNKDRSRAEKLVADLTVQVQDLTKERDVLMAQQADLTEGVSTRDQAVSVIIL